jgi:hypothetical protein
MTPQTSQQTVAEVLGLIDEWTDQTDRRRRDFRAALRILARASGRPLDAVHLSPETVRDLLGRNTAKSLHISDASLASYRSALRYVLRRLGLLPPATTARRELPPNWSALLDGLPDRFSPMTLGGFAAFCAARSLGPREVDDAVLQAYAEHLREADIRVKAWDRARRVATVWNRAGDVVTGWPAHRLTAVQPRNNRYAPAFTAYPATLQAEIARFAARIGGGTTAEGTSSLFTGDGPPVRLRSTSVRSRLASLRVALAALVHTGTTLDEITSLAFLVERRRTVLDWHFVRAGRRANQTTSAIASTLAIIAKHELKLSDDALRAVLDDLRRARPPVQREMTPKNTARLRALEDPSVQAALLRLPQRLMLLAKRMRDGWTDAAGDHPPQPHRAAWLASIAVAVEILTCCPLRLSNLVGLRIGVHLQSANGRRGRFTHLSIEPHETKNRVRIECPIERQTADLLAVYVRDFRPLLAPPGSDWVFPSREHADRPRDKAGFGTAITQAIHEHVGVRMHPHLFRSFAGALILSDNPHALDDLRAVLGHMGFETAIRHYRSASTRGAAERLNRLVAARRATIRPDVPPSDPRRGARRRRRS